MAVSRHPVKDDRQLVRYLLGDLPDEEAERLDEQSVVDDDFAERLRIAEDDLVDEYVSGTLPEDLRARFEANYLASPRRRQKVAFVRKLLGAVERAAPPALAPVGVPSAGPARGRTAWSLAAAAILVLGSTVLVFQGTQLRASLREAQRLSAAADERAHVIAGELAQQHAANVALEQDLARLRGAQAPLAGVALVLLPQTRGVGPVPIVALHRGSALVPFELQVETSGFTGYQATLRDPATARIVWRSSPLTAVASTEPPSVYVAVPAAVMKAQHYALELSGRRGSGAPEIIGTYAFQIR